MKKNLKKVFFFQNSMPTSLLDYFPEAKGDGLRVTWARGTNNKARLASALRSKKVKVLLLTNI